MSALSDAYRDIALRHLRAARLLTDAGLPEVAAFHCYHAFESVAAATISQRSGAVPRPHAKKIAGFLARSTRQPFQASAAVLASRLLPLRNRVLYPDVYPGALGAEHFVLEGDASDLVRRVDGFVRTVISVLNL